MINKDPNIDKLYQDTDKAQPPKAIDDAIMARAQQAHQPTRLGRLRPWLAAASVLLAVPILWLMLEQPELQQARQESLQPEPVPSVPMSTDSAKPNAKAKTSADTIDLQDSETDQDTITVTGSRLRHQEPESDAAGLEAPAPAEKKRATAKEVQQDNQAFSELKTEQEAMAEDNMASAPASYVPLNTQMQQTAEAMTDLIARLKPEVLAETEQAMWQGLQQQINQQQWQQSLKTLQQLKQSHPDINFEPLNALLKNISTD